MTRTIRFTLPIAGLSMPAQQEALRVAIYQRLPPGWRVDNLGKNLSPDGKEAAITLQISPMGSGPKLNAELFNRDSNLTRQGMRDLAENLKR